jgi:hypothetical protein
VSAWREITGRARQPKKKRKRKPLFTCGRCGDGFSSPLGHVCAGGGDFGRRGRAARAAAARRKRQEAAAARRQAERDRIAAVRKAERERGARRAAAARQAERARGDARVARAKAGSRPAARPGRPAHDYRDCRDDACERPACMAWRDGLAEGRETGYEDGFDAGAASTRS